MNKIVWAVLAMSLVSCSNKQLYDAARHNYLQDCDKWEGAERERCKERYQDSYAEYERKRNEALSDESSKN